MTYISRGHGPGTQEHFDRWYDQFSEADGLMMNSYLKAVSDFFVISDLITSDLEDEAKEIIETASEDIGRRLEQYLDAMTDLYAHANTDTVNGRAEFLKLMDLGHDTAMEDFRDAVLTTDISEMVLNYVFLTYRYMQNNYKAWRASFGEWGN